MKLRLPAVSFSVTLVTHLQSHAILATQSGVKSRKLLCGSCKKKPLHACMNKSMDPQSKHVHLLFLSQNVRGLGVTCYVQPHVQTPLLGQHSLMRSLTNPSVLHGYFFQLHALDSFYSCDTSMHRDSSVWCKCPIGS